MSLSLNAPSSGPQNNGRAAAVQTRPPSCDFWKRPMDVAFASVLLILTAPLIFLAALAVKLTSRGPAFYSQVRLGRNGKPFLIRKIRTMTTNCESLTGVRWAMQNDSRTTFVGRILRPTHIDELPQFWNVLCGDMSMIGPRPERPEFVPQLERVIPRYKERLLLRPGITGLAQIQLPADTDRESVRRKLAVDLYYLENISLWLDLRLVVATAFYLMAVPFWLTGKLLFIPTGRVVLGDCVEPLPSSEHALQPAHALQAPHALEVFCEPPESSFAGM